MKDNNLDSIYFNQNEGSGGFEIGNYDLLSVHPTTTNWTRKSRYVGPQKPIKVKEITFKDMKESSNLIVGRNGVIYFGGYDGYLYAVSSTGEILWKLDLGQPLGTPAISGDETIYIASSESERTKSYHLYAVSVEGKVKWACRLSNTVSFPPVLDKEGYIYIILHANQLCKIGPDGQLIWKFRKEKDFWSAPIISKDEVILVGDCDEKVYGVNKEGRELWEAKVGHGMPNYLPLISESGLIYITADADDREKLIVINSCGENQWEFVPDVGDVITNVAYNGELLYMYATYFRIMAVNKEGKLLWETKLEGFANYPPIIDICGNIYIGTHNEISGKAYTWLYCIDPNGKKKWEYKAKDSLNSFILSANNTIYLTTNNFKKEKSSLYIIGDKVK